MKTFISIGIAAFTSAVSANAALTENFDTYPSGGSGWTGSWSNSTLGNLVTPSVSNANPLNGGGNYLSVTTAVSSTELGIKRSLGALAASPYTLTFDWRLDSATASFAQYNDRIHIGANNDGDFGTDANWAWIIGVVGGDNGGTLYDDGKWYFYDNTSTTTDGNFSSSNMKVSTMSVTAGVTYSFVVTVNPATQKWDASITDGTTTYTQTGMDFRNQTAATDSFTNLVFGGSNTTQTGEEALAWSLDNINIVPEPSSLLLAGLSGLLCFKRRRIAG